MDDQSIKHIVNEIQPLLVGRSPGKIFQLDAGTIVIDFRLRDHRTLLISVNPVLARIHLISRRIRDLEKQNRPLGQFALTLRKQASNSRLVSITKEPADRIVRLEFSTAHNTDPSTQWTLMAQLTGRSANLLLLDANDVVTHRLRATHVEGQQIGDSYKPPKTTDVKKSKEESEVLTLMERGKFKSPSDAADAYYQSLASEKEFEKKAAAARARLKTAFARERKLLKKLEDDLASHANAEHHKRIGDLLLANVATAKRSGKRVTLVDYFDDNNAPIEVEIDEHLSLPEEASRRFDRYSRAKRAISSIKSRIETVKREIGALAVKQQELDRIISARDTAALDKLSGQPAGDLSVPLPSAGRAKRIPGTRRYISSDGLEILVGRGARDNDYLTFKVARPNDLWLHSADYPGSHVIVLNPTRKEVPHRTIIEAAQLAAYFSQASKNPKVDVHYTSRKFLSKPKGAATGLVRMSRFKNITVEPKEILERC